MRTTPWLVLALALSTAVAAGEAELTLPGGAGAVVRPAGASHSGPATLPLRPGEQVCVTVGTASLVENGARRTLSAGSCFQLPAPRSLFDSLAAVVTGWIPKGNSAASADAKSRGGACGDSPALHLPRDYSLPSLSLPVVFPPNPRTLRLLDAAGRPTYTEVRERPGETFAVPTARLLAAARIEVANPSSLLYASEVKAVDFAGPPGEGPADGARRLLDTGLLEYGPAIYSLLAAAGSAEAAELVQAEIDSCSVSR